MRGGIRWAWPNTLKQLMKVIEGAFRSFSRALLCALGCTPKLGSSLRTGPQHNVADHGGELIRNGPDAERKRANGFEEGVVA
jgi:hypothetical protein